MKRCELNSKHFSHMVKKPLQTTNHYKQHLLHIFVFLFCKYLCGRFRVEEQFVNFFDLFSVDGVLAVDLCQQACRRQQLNWVSVKHITQCVPYIQAVQHAQIDWLSRAQRPTKHIIGHIGDWFYGPNDPTNSVKAVKEVMVLTMWLQSHQIHLTMLQTHTCTQHTVGHKQYEWI